jgi:DnaJ-domain-containing protein 1
MDSKIIKIIMGGVLCWEPFAMDAASVHQPSPQGQGNFNKSAIEKLIAEVNSRIGENAIRTTALSTRKEIDEKLIKPFKENAYGDRTDIYVIRMVTTGVEKAFADLPVAVQANQELCGYVRNVKSLLKAAEVMAAFAMLGLPKNKINETQVERALKKKLESKPGVLIAREERDKYFLAADIVKQSEYFTNQLTPRVSATDADYALLGLKKGASADEVKRAYRKAVLKYHPDKFSGYKGKPGYECKTKEEATAKFQGILNAYERLMEQSQSIGEKGREHE